MCQSIADGGQRCVAHTRPRYQALMQALDDCGTGFGSSQRRTQVRQRFMMDDENATNIVLNHASTSGHRDVERDIERFAQIDPALAGMMRAQLRLGLERGAANKEVTQAIRKERKLTEARAKGWRESGSTDLMRPTERVFSGKLVAVGVELPRIHEIWKPEDNISPVTGKPVGPDEVSQGSNAALNWRCPEGHLNISGEHGNWRVNTVAPRLREHNKFPICPQCQPHRQRQFKQAQEQMQDLVAALDGDPEALACLSPALQFSLMQKMGFHAQGRGNVLRDVSMSLVHGDLSLKDVMRADDFNKLENRIRDINEDEETLKTLVDVEVDQHVAKERSQATAVKQVMESAGVLAFADPDSELAQNIMRENVEALWDQANKNPDGLDKLIATVNANRGRSRFADELADRFTGELDAVRNFPLPDGYTTSRVMPDGSIKEIEPSLSQRRFAYMTVDRRRVFNWSGTGAGKTTASALAVQAVGAEETLVVCPKPVIKQWVNEFQSGYGDKVEVRVGLPTGDEPPPTPGVNRVWVANYDKFQGNSKGEGIDPNVQEKVSRLIGKVDAIVFDEIHMAKRSEPGTSSLRRNTLEQLVDKAGAANPDLAVIGCSATGVINNLEEAASELRLVEGPTSKRFPTKPTIKNAVTAHHRLAAAGIRHMPNYPTKLTRNDVTVDVSNNLARVHARVAAMQKARKDAGKPNPERIHAAMMERALLPEKLPTIVEKCKASNTPTIVYTEYTKGMVEPIEKALTESGLRVARYTGDENDRDREATLQRFQRGEIDVIVGSKPIATGVDGLQHTSHRMIVASMSWTAAQDDQLVGRLQRTGQQQDVEVDYVLTEAKVGSATWSWCKDNRQKRVRFKRGLADAAMDGVIPDGVLESGHTGADESAAALNKLVSAFTAKPAA